MVVGCGFLGGAAADFFLARGDRVLGITASASSAELLIARGIEARAIDVSRPFPIGEWGQGLDVLVYSVSSPRGAGVAGYEAVYFKGFQRTLKAFRPAHAVFVSSTSVYGQSRGEWVTEDSETKPQVATGDVLLRAESEALFSRGCVLRLAGIYGPKRSVLLRKYLEGSASLELGGERWINQIHRDDAARAVVHAATSRLRGIFNVADDHPASQRAIYSWIAEAVGGELPPDGPQQRRKRGNTNKRVSNRRLKELGWQPLFPAYRDALPALLAVEN